MDYPKSPPVIEYLFSTPSGSPSLLGAATPTVFTRHDQVQKLHELSGHQAAPYNPLTVQSTDTFQFPIPVVSYGDPIPQMIPPTVVIGVHLPRLTTHALKEAGGSRRPCQTMDDEPVSPTHRPPGHLRLGNFPIELHLSIFDCLDRLESTCLGLTNKHFYDLHRRIHGAVPLAAERTRPSGTERVWYMAAMVPNLGAASTDPLVPSVPGDTELALLRVRGQAFCRRCGICRCQLYKHIQEWFPDDLEYCRVREKFGPVAPRTALGYCARGNSNNPNRCRGHPDRTSRLLGMS